MFSEAYKIASEFTLPVVISRRRVDGTCGAGLGAAVVVNNEGWVVTACHIMQGFSALHDEVAKTQQTQAERKAVEADTTLSASQRKNKLSTLKLNPKAHDRCSISFSLLPVGFTQWKGLEIADLAVAKLEPWDPAWVATYPQFKDPTKDFDYGTSLCKLGFPFHKFTPSFDETQNGFVLPPEALPVPRFPMEGIFTRTIDIQVPGSPTPPFPMR